jgi:transcriptional regulator with XRE-family HTH domain
MYNNIGDFIRGKRTENGLTLRALSERLGISITYLTDIEHDRRNPMDLNKLQELAEILELSPEEKNEMFDLAGQKRREVPPDLLDYVLRRPYVIVALRKARDAGAGEEEWMRMITDLERRTRWKKTSMRRKWNVCLANHSLPATATKATALLEW